MNREELTIAIAGALFAALLLGWILRWLFGRINGSGPRSLRRTAALADQLHALEESSRRTEKRLAEAEAELSETRAELRAALRNLSLAEAQAEELRTAYRVQISDRRIEAL